MDLYNFVSFFVRRDFVVCYHVCDKLVCVTVEERLRNTGLTGNREKYYCPILLW